MEEVDLFLNSDGSIPPGIDSDYTDSKGDNLFPERLLHDDPIPLPDILDFSNIVRIFPPFFTYSVTSSILLSSQSDPYNTCSTFTGGGYIEGMMPCRGRTQLDVGEHGRTVGLADDRHLPSKKTKRITDAPPPLEETNRATHVFIWRYKPEDILDDMNNLGIFYKW
nr:hypothetical protein [Tanacetum cinerariifolium]